MGLLELPRELPESLRAQVVRWAPWVALGASLLLVAIFVELSDELFEPPHGSARLLGVDATILLQVARLRRPWLNAIAMDLTALGSPVIVALFCCALGAVLLVASDRRGAAILFASCLASAPLTLATKALLERPRPAVVPRLVEVMGLSYPSGHSLASAAVYLTAAWVVARHLPTWKGRIGAVVSTAAVVVLIGASRVYLGVHYPSDVVAGVLLGLAWALAMLAVLRRLDTTSAAAGAASSAYPGSRTAVRDG